METDNPISAELEAKLKNSDSDIQKYINELSSIIFHLQTQNIKLEAKNKSFHARINRLEKELDKKEQLEEISREERNKIIKKLDDKFEQEKRTLIFSEDNLKQLSPDEIVMLSNILKKLGFSLG